MDIYIVRDGDRIVGASAKLQGAELIRSDASKQAAGEYATLAGADLENAARLVYDGMWIENHELQDDE